MVSGRRRLRIASENGAESGLPVRLCCTLYLRAGGGSARHGTAGVTEACTAGAVGLMRGQKVAHAHARVRTSPCVVRESRKAHRQVRKRRSRSFGCQRSAPCSSLYMSTTSKVR